MAKNKGIARKHREDKMWAAFERQAKSYADCAEGRHRVHSEPVEVRFKDGSKLMRHERHNCSYADPLEFLKREERDSDHARSIMERTGYARVITARSSVGDAGSAPCGAEGGATEAPKSRKARHRKQRSHQPAGGSAQGTSRAAVTTP